MWQDPHTPSPDRSDGNRPGFGSSGWPRFSREPEASPHRLGSPAALSGDADAPERSHPLVPEISSEAERHLDHQLAQALFDVDVPSGLAERIVARLNELPQAASREAAQASHDTVPVDALLQTSRSARWSRRRWGAALASGSVAALIAGWWWLGGAAVSSEEILSHALQLAMQAPRTADGNSARVHGEAEAFPYSRSVIRPRTFVRYALSDFLGHSGVAYDLQLRKVRAKLVVLQMRGSGLAEHPALRPDVNTAGRCVSAWQEGGLVYVLIVEGTEREYRRFTDVPRQLV